MVISSCSGCRFILFVFLFLNLSAKVVIVVVFRRRVPPPRREAPPSSFSISSAAALLTSRPGRGEGWREHQSRVRLRRAVFTRRGNPKLFLRPKTVPPTCNCLSQWNERVTAARLRASNSWCPRTDSSTVNPLLAGERPSSLSLFSSLAPPSPYSLLPIHVR